MFSSGMASASITRSGGMERDRNARFAIDARDERRDK